MISRKEQEILNLVAIDFEQNFNEWVLDRLAYHSIYAKNDIFIHSDLDGDYQRYYYLLDIPRQEEFSNRIKKVIRNKQEEAKQKQLDTLLKKVRCL